MERRLPISGKPLRRWGQLVIDVRHKLGLYQILNIQELPDTLYLQDSIQTSTRPEPIYEKLDAILEITIEGTLKFTKILAKYP